MKQALSVVWIAGKHSEEGSFSLRISFLKANYAQPFLFPVVTYFFTDSEPMVNFGATSHGSTNCVSCLLNTACISGPSSRLETWWPVSEDTARTLFLNLEREAQLFPSFFMAQSPDLKWAPCQPRCTLRGRSRGSRFLPVWAPPVGMFLFCQLKVKPAPPLFPD